MSEPSFVTFGEKGVKGDPGPPGPPGGGVAFSGDLSGDSIEQYVRGTSGNDDGDLETKHQTYGQSTDGRFGKVATLDGLAAGGFFESVQYGWPNNTRAIIDVRAVVVASVGVVRLQRTYAVESVGGFTTAIDIGPVASDAYDLPPGEFELTVVGVTGGIAARLANDSAGPVNVSLSWDGDRMPIP